MVLSYGKSLQRRILNLLVDRTVFLALVGFLTIIIVSITWLGEKWIVIRWTRDKYRDIFNSFSDNLAGHSMRDQLCQHVPIDVVYTWVNGSDPVFLDSLKHATEKLHAETSRIHDNPKNYQHQKCYYKDCATSHFLTIPTLVDFTTLQIKTQNPQFSNLVNIQSQNLICHHASQQNRTFLVMNSVESAKDIDLTKEIKIGLKNKYRATHAYWTTDRFIPNTFAIPDHLILTKLPSSTTKEKLLYKLPLEMAEKVKSIWLYMEKSMAVIELKDQSAEKFAGNDIKVGESGGNILVSMAYLLVDFPSAEGPFKDVEKEASSLRRFTDWDELKYSLRSLEKYAPWVRHVYIVTNGQIPSWLDMENSRITLVTHEEIFADKSHLPTFSSAAIEANLHRIKGLSDKFLYFNDDIFLGEPIWPNDFLSGGSTGQKIYFEYPLPDCSSGCPMSWIKDGYCDKVCNTTSCMYDGGDCIGDNVKIGMEEGQMNHVFHGQDEDQQVSFANPYKEYEKSFCSPFCQNTWIADNYCDDKCNVKECGYDAGDCGINNYAANLYQVPFVFNASIKDWDFKVPDGKTVAYWNMTQVFKQYIEIGIMPKVRHQGLMEEKSLASTLRSISFSDAHKVLTLVLYENVDSTTLKVEIRKSINSDGESEVIHNFAIHVNTKNTTIKAKDIDAEKIVKPLDGKEIETIIEGKEVDFEAEKNDKDSLVQNDVKSLKDGDNLENELKNGNQNFDNIVKGENAEQNSGIAQTLKKKQNDTNLKAIIDPVLENSGRKDNDDSKGQLKPEKDNQGDINGVDLVLKNDDKQVSLDKENLRHDNLETDKEGNDKDINPEQDKHLEKQLPAIKSNDQDEQRIDEKDQIKKEQQNVNKAIRIEQKGRNGTNFNNEGSKVNSKISQNETKLNANSGIIDVPIDMKEENNDRLLEKKKKVPHQAKNEIVGKDASHLNKETDVGNRFDDAKEDDVIQNEHILPPGSNRKLLSLHDSAVLNNINSEVESWKNPSLDIYGNSLLYTNRQFDISYGHNARKVIAHMPHLIDLNIFNQMLAKFPNQWDETSSHKLRSAEDMQYEFSYFHFLISEKSEFYVSEVFDEFDTDHSNSWSDREIRTLLTRIYSLPLSSETVLDFEEMITNCASNESLTVYLPQPVVSDYPPYERYYDSRLPPVVTKELISVCAPMRDFLWQHFRHRNRYPHQIMEDTSQYLSFKRLTSDVNDVIALTDDLRKRPMKFICINDETDFEKPEDNVVIQAHLMDFYESMFPVPSQFELPPYYRNKYLHLDEFLKYWRIRRLLSVGFYLVLIMVLLIVFANLCNVNLYQQLKLVAWPFQKLLLLLTPNMLLSKKLHPSKRNQSNLESEESKYDV